MGASTVLDIGGRKVRGRQVVEEQINLFPFSVSCCSIQYPWGVVDIENTEHSDFVFLKRFLIQTHMQVWKGWSCLDTFEFTFPWQCNAVACQDLKDVTHDVHYENYRLTCLGELRAQVGIHCNMYSTCMVVGFRTFCSQIWSYNILPGNRCWRHKHGTEKDVLKEVQREFMESTFEQFPSPERALPRQRASTRIPRRWCCSTRKTRRSRRCKPCWTRCSRSSTPDHRKISQRDKLAFKAGNLDSGFLAPTVREPSLVILD